jgi:hypothetical protein
VLALLRILGLAELYFEVNLTLYGLFFWTGNW